jgi:hypothetical protein
VFFQLVGSHCDQPFFKLAIYCQKAKLKNKRLKKVVLGIFSPPEVRGKKLKIIRFFLYVVFIE